MITMMPRYRMKLLPILFVGLSQVWPIFADKEAGREGSAEFEAEGVGAAFDEGARRHRLSPRKWRLDKSGVYHRIESIPEVVSCFQNLEKGGFVGSVSGLLVVEVPSPDRPGRNPSTVRHLMPFESKGARLDIIPDVHEIYDVSTKRYSASAPQGCVVYETYHDANALSLTLGREVFGFTAIDGACEGEIAALDYRFFSDDANEYLVLTVEKPLPLDARENSERQAVLKPGSVLVFRFRQPSPSK